MLTNHIFHDKILSAKGETMKRKKTTPKLLKPLIDPKSQEFLHALNNNEQNNKLVLTEAQARELRKRDKKPEEPLIEM